VTGVQTCALPIWNGKRTTVHLHARCDAAGEEEHRDREWERGSPPVAKRQAGCVYSGHGEGGGDAGRYPRRTRWFRLSQPSPAGDAEMPLDLALGAAGGAALHAEILAARRAESNGSRARQPS